MSDWLDPCVCTSDGVNPVCELHGHLHPLVREITELREQVEALTAFIREHRCTNCAAEAEEALATAQAAPEPESKCVCGETSARNCPVHSSAIATSDAA